MSTPAPHDIVRARDLEVGGVTLLSGKTWAALTQIGLAVGRGGIRRYLTFMPVHGDKKGQLVVRSPRDRDQYPVLRRF